MGKAETLRESPLFANLNEDEMEMIAELCKEKVYEPEKIIFQEGDEGLDSSWL